MLGQVRETIRQFNMIKEGDTVVAGISGGADSVCLLLNLIEYKREVSFGLEVVHVNHMIRNEAASDAKFVRKLCEREGIPYHLYEIDIKAMASDKHLSIEEAGRVARYNAYMEVLGTRPGVIALGHHRDDLVETVFFNICRGSGIHGLSGIEPVRDNIIRPLINCRRSDIEQYLLSKNESYVTDATNLVPDYTRNKIRLEVIPYLEREINSGTSDRIAELAKNVSLLKEYIDAQVDEEINRIKISEDASGTKIHEAEYNLEELTTLPEFLKGEVILEAIHRFNNGRKDITRRHIDSILNLIKSDGEKKLNLPYGIEVTKSYKTLALRYSKSAASEAATAATTSIAASENATAAATAATTSIAARENATAAASENATAAASEVATAATTSIAASEAAPTGLGMAACAVDITSLLESSKDLVTINVGKNATLKARVFTLNNMDTMPQKEYTKWFDYDKIKSRVVLRTRQSGDYFCTNSEMQTKRIKDYFIDEKIPRSERDEVLLIADGQHIMWVVGHRISEYYKVDDSTKRVIEMTIEGNN